jgi:hypothetical protein
MNSKSIRLVPAKRQDSDFLEEDLMKAPDGYFLEINAIDILEASPNVELLDAICQKIRKNGKIILNGVDGMEMCRKVFYGQINLRDAAQQFFGPINNLYSIPSLKEYFLNKKWDIRFAGLQDGRYLIEAVRT